MQNTTVPKMKDPQLPYKMNECSILNLLAW